jgi:hypothetical protein
MLGGVTAALLELGPTSRIRPTRAKWRPRLGAVMARAGVSVAIVAAVASSVPSTASAMLYNPIASEEQLHLNYILRPQPGNLSEAGERDRYASTVAIAKALDKLNLPHGAVLLDNFSPCVPYIILNSKHPQQFVIPNDRDFEAELADPPTFHVQYLLVPPGAGYGCLDALNRQYPDLYNTGDITSEIASLVNAWALPGCPSFRLYHVTPPPGAPGQ